MSEMTSYDVALEQFIKETGLSKKDFDSRVDEHGYEYVSYYEKRWLQDMAGYAF